VWIVVVLITFFAQDLPNNPAVSRLDVIGLLADDVLGTGEPSPPSPTASGLPFLSQRLPIAAFGIVLLTSAWCLGAAGLRLVASGIPMPRGEQLVLQFGLGLSTLSLLTLAAGVLGWLNRPAILLPAFVALLYLVFSSRIRRKTRPAGSTNSGAVTSVTANGQSSPKQKRRRPLSTTVFEVAMWLTIIGTTLWIMLGSISPPTDFDVREYHLQGPKEWFQQGCVSFLPHNVYTSFPFLSEMLSLSAMVLVDDWWIGALTGKFVLATFAPLTAMCVFCIVRRLVDQHIGLLAALIHISTPWTVRISLIAYAEGALSFYLSATTLALLLFRQAGDNAGRRRVALVIGLLSGSAMACKYTGLVSAVIPAAMATVVFTAAGAVRPRTGHLRAALVYTGLLMTGVLVAVGPWLIRNTATTGNPVYPLAYGILGGVDWDDEVNERWKAAHSPNEHALSQLPQHVLDVAIRNDWTSPLLFSLAMPAVFLWRRIPGLPLIALLTAWQFTAWWALTHRIDRFWVPAIPLVAVMAACSRRMSSTRTWRVCFITVVAACTVFNLRFISLPLVGYHAGLQDLTAARQLVIRSDLRQLNKMLPADARVLMVGEAEVFDCTFPLLYNTVFDANLFQSLVSTTEATTADAPSFKSPAELREALKSAGITHVFVNWLEILRYRSPGSYGYAEFVQPERFHTLVTLGILQPPDILATRTFAELSEQQQQTVMSWVEIDYLMPEPDVLQAVQLFAVTR
jgi:hypothetical protein